MKFKRSILICLSSLNARICLWRCTLIYKHVASVISRFRVFKESFNEIFVIPRNMGEEEPSTRMKWCAEARFKRVSRYVLSSKLLHHYWCVRGTVKHSFHGVILETALCNVHPQKAGLVIVQHNTSGSTTIFILSGGTGALGPGLSTVNLKVLNTYT